MCSDSLGANGDDVSPWLSELGITSRATGQEEAKASREELLAAGRRVLGAVEDYTVACIVFSGLFARAQGLHEGATSAITTDNPYGAFTLLRAYAENAAALLYVKDHPGTLDAFWRDRDAPGIKIGKMTTYAERRFGNFRAIYSQLSRYAHPQALSILASTQLTSDNKVEWSSVPRFKSDDDAMVACAWVKELAVATSHLLLEFAEKFGLWPGSVPPTDTRGS